MENSLQIFLGYFSYFFGTNNISSYIFLFIYLSQPSVPYFIIPSLQLPYITLLEALKTPHGGMQYTGLSYKTLVLLPQIMGAGHLCLRLLATQ